MDVVLTIARIVLAGIWGIAAVGKLLDWKRAPAPLARLGLPGWVFRPIAAGLPLLELLLAVLLLSGSAVPVGAIASFGLLISFTIVLVIRAGRGTTGGCGCLGRFERTTLPVAALVRTELLAALAAAIVWIGWGRPFPSLLSWLIPTYAWQWFLIAGVAGALGLRRPLATVWGRITDFVAWRTRAAMTASAGLPVGTLAPITYRPQGLEALLFVGDQCTPCEHLLSTLPARAKVPAIRILSISGRDTQSARTYRVPGLPAAVLIGPDGRIASALAVGAVAVRSLLDRD